ncbi:MAG TPA: CDP-alcohol phosphatidyltransferase family protein, partial [Dongiaceae bacterium]|nr:CDP-alcohol phosphatidyltransferase family protein [Dongiaceae bacterium]
ALLTWGLTANGVTFSQLAASVVCGVAYAQGWMFTAGWMLLASGTLDILDGEMARRHGAAGPRGAFIDSVVDRYGEAAVFAGLVAFYRHDWVLWAVLAAWLGAFLVSYTRARAEGLGVECLGGLLQRPERYVLLGGASIASALAVQLTCGARDRHGILAAGVCVVAALANLTAVQRARATVRRLR